MRTKLGTDKLPQQQIPYHQTLSELENNLNMKQNAPSFSVTTRIHMIVVPEAPHVLESCTHLQSDWNVAT